MATPDALSIIGRLVAHVEGESVPGDILADGRGLLEWLSKRSVEALATVVQARAHPPGEIPSWPAEVFSAAALNDEEIEVLIISREGADTRHQAFTVGPVAARSAIWLLKEAVHDLERARTP